MVNILLVMLGLQRLCGALTEFHNYFREAAGTNYIKDNKNVLCTRYREVGSCYDFFLQTL